MLPWLRLLLRPLWLWLRLWLRLLTREAAAWPSNGHPVLADLPMRPQRTNADARRLVPERLHAHPVFGWTFGHDPRTAERERGWRLGRL